MKTVFKIFVVFCLGTLAGAMAFSPVAEAQSGAQVRRARTWEFFLPIRYLETTTIDGQGGSSANLSDDVGFGFGFGYNFNEHFALGMDLAWSDINYDATVVRQSGTIDRISSVLYTASTRLNLTYYQPLPVPITPFVTGGLGITRVDTNIPSGTGSTVCWWDPWWGYVCDSYVPTLNETDYSYNLGLGARWDITEAFALRAGYTKEWIDFDNSGQQDFTLWRLDLVFRMPN